MTIERAKLLTLATACEQHAAFEDAAVHEAADYLWRGGAISGDDRAQITGWLGHEAALIAARSLVPAGVWWRLEQSAGATGSGKSFFIASITMVDQSDDLRGIANTDALALLAAALRARAALMPEEQAAA